MMSVILYLWVILELYHYDSRMSLKNLNIENYLFFFFLKKTFQIK